MKKNLPVTQKAYGFPSFINILSTTDLKGAITHINDDFVEVSGFERAEPEGKNHDMVRHPDMPPPPSRTCGTPSRRGARGWGW